MHRLPCLNMGATRLQACEVYLCCLEQGLQNTMCHRKGLNAWHYQTLKYNSTAQQHNTTASSSFHPAGEGATPLVTDSRRDQCCESQCWQVNTIMGMEMLCQTVSIVGTHFRWHANQQTSCVTPG